MLSHEHLEASANEIALLKHILRSGCATRGELVSRTGLTLMTVSKLMASLLKTGLLRQDGTVSGGMGRRRELFRVNPSHRYALGVDIGYASLKVGVVGFDGEIVEKAILPATENPVARGLPLEPLFCAARNLIEKHGRERFLGVGAGISGMVDFARGTVLFCPNISGFDERPLARELEDALGLPALLDTSARCMALGEKAFGAGYGVDDLLFLSLGMGTIAAGIVARGRLYRGADGFAGEIGHVRVEGSSREVCTCGLRGCLELSATMSMAMRSTEGENAPQAFAEAYRKGDEGVVRCVRGVAKGVGRALADAVNLIDPSRIVVGGGFAEHLPELVALVDAEVKSRCLVPIRQRLSVVKSALGADAPIRGSAMQIISRYLDEEATT